MNPRSVRLAPSARASFAVAGALAVLAGLGAGCNDDHDGHVREERIASAVPLGAQTALRIETRTADVRLTTSPDDTVRILTYKRVQSMSERSIDALWKQIRVTMEREGNELVLRVREPERGTSRVTVQAGPWRMRRGVEIELTVAVPRNAKIGFVTERGDLEGHDLTQELTLELVTGDAELERLSGAVNVSATSGDVTLRDVSAPVSVRSTSGDVEIERVKGPVTVRATSGGVTLSHIDGRVAVETSSGDIGLADANGSVRMSASSGEVTIDAHVDSLVVETSSGDLTASTTNAPGFVSLRTSSGAVVFTLPPGTGGELDAQTSTGAMSVSSALDVTQMSRNHLSGRLGGKGTTTIRTSSGDIKIESGAVESQAAGAAQ
jgi:hypothetical protein